MAFAELGLKAFEQADLLVGELDGVLPGVLFEAEEPLVFGQEIMTFPDAADAAGGDVGLAQGELLGDTEAAVGGKSRQ